MSVPLTRSALHAAGALLLLAGMSHAHVGLNSPDGGEVLQPGQLVTIEWLVVIPHSMLNWDLFYSTTGDAPWTPIATDLPTGDPSQGSIHTYDWVVPATPSDTVRVRVVMDTAGADYTDQSLLPFAIQSLGGDVSSVSLSAGGTQNLTIGAGVGRAGMLYLVLGSASGTTPGLPLDGVVLPLVLDDYTLFTLNNPNTLIGGSLGLLDAAGQAAATLTIPPGQKPSLAGVALDHAYAVLDQLGTGTVVFASNPVALAFAP